MKISLNWLRDYIDIDPKQSPEEIAARITEATAEIEAIEYVGKDLDNVVVGELISTEKHPEADKLHVAQVKVSNTETIQVIYGDKAQVKVGDKVPTVVAPLQLHGGEIKSGEIRGVMSHGMLCLDSELLEGWDAELTIFPADTKVGTPITELLPLQDIVYEIDNHSITHRPDLFSQYGFTRELVALGLASWKKQAEEYDLEKMLGKEELPFSVSFEDKELCKNYNGTIVSGLDSRKAPLWMKARLQACGIRSINALVDITNYVMLEFGAPMHAFDKDSLADGKFEFRRSKKGESMTTLDGKEQKLGDDIMLVENGGKIVDLVGIMGGQNSEVKDSTTSVYFHQGVYDPVMIRKAMIELGHRTDAGTIYEKGPEPEISELGMGRTLELSKEIFPDAQFNYRLLHIQNQKSESPKVQLTFEKLKKYIGEEILPKDCERILTDLGFKVKMNKEELEAVAPCWRAADVQITEDLIEEIIRIYGFSNITSAPPTIQLKTPVRDPKRHLRRTIQSYLTGLGYLEEANFSFLSEELLQKLGEENLDECIEVANPVTNDFQYMRPSLLPYLLNNLSRNQIMDKRDWLTFEFGSTFAQQGKEISQPSQLMIVMAKESDLAFADMKKLVEGVMFETGRKLTWNEAGHSKAYPGRVLSLHIGDHEVGSLYEIHPMLADRFKISGSVIIADISFDTLVMTHQEDIHYQHINRKPEAYLDINVVVDHDTKVGDIESVINAVQTQYLKKSELMDIYEGKNLGEGKKSFTFSLTYQHPERTLEESEIQKIVEELIQQLEKNGGVVRR